MELISQLFVLITIAIAAALSAEPVPQMEAPRGENTLLVSDNEQVINSDETLVEIGFDEIRQALDKSPSADNIRRSAIFAFSFGGGLLLTFLLQTAATRSKRRRKEKGQEIPEYTGWDSLYLPVFLALIGGVFLQSTLALYETVLAGIFFFIAIALVLSGVFKYLKGSPLLVLIFLGAMVLPATAIFYVGDMIAVGDKAIFNSMEDELIAVFSVSLAVAFVIGNSYLLFIRASRHLFSKMVNEEAMTTDSTTEVHRNYDSQGNRRDDGSNFGDFL